MRNLLEYPITKEEIAECLDKLAMDIGYEDGFACGDMRPLLLAAAKEVILASIPAKPAVGGEALANRLEACVQGHTWSVSTEDMLEAARLIRAAQPASPLPAVGGEPDLTDPVVVHMNMLRGTIAKPTWAQIKLLYPEETARTSI